MAKKYTGSLTLEWFNKNRSIITQKIEQKRDNDIPAPRINWINKDEALFYEISEEEGKGLTPYWVDRNDIRVKESRPLVFQKAYKAVPNETGFKVEESDMDDPEIENILIKGDNLLALNTLKKMFDQKPDDEKVKCIYIDPPYKTGSAFEYYDDNLAMSEWLSMISDRLKILKDILSDSGMIFVQIDNNSFTYLNALMDEIFRKENFIQFISVKRASPAGFKTINPGPVTVTEYITVYAKYKPKVNFKPVYISVGYDNNYNLVIENIDDRPEKWKLQNIDSIIYKENGILGWENPAKAWRNAEKKWGEPWKIIRESLRGKYALEHSNKVISVRDPHKPSDSLKKLLSKSKYDKEKVFVLERQNNNNIYVYNGGSISFYKNKIKEIDNELNPTELLTDFWTDINYAGIAKEGSIKFKNNKKPEMLIKRVLEIATDENDLILDIFGGSGTTFAVSQKMNRRWIGVELGNHADTHIIKRLKHVISGEDQSGISKKVNWKGGGSFKYYHLGESIISLAEDGYGDFNWSLGRDFIEKSLLATYNFILDDKLKLPGSTIEHLPKVGFYDVNNYTMAGIVSLASPDEKKGPLENDYINDLISAIRKYKSPQSITIFTNRGVEMAWESKPEDVEIIKVPHAIFAELER